MNQQQKFPIFNRLSRGTEIKYKPYGGVVEFSDQLVRETAIALDDEATSRWYVQNVYDALPKTEHMTMIPAEALNLYEIPSIPPFSHVWIEFFDVQAQAHFGGLIRRVDDPDQSTWRVHALGLRGNDLVAYPGYTNVSFSDDGVLWERSVQTDFPPKLSEEQVYTTHLFLGEVGS